MDDNSASSSQPSPTSTPTPKIRAVELERYVQANRRISMSIAPSTEKSISPHVVRFSQAIGVCNFFMLDFNDQAINGFVEHQMLNTFKEFRGDYHRHFKKYSDLEKSRANLPYILLEHETFVSQATEDAHGSQPLSEDEICETVLGRRSDTQKALVGDPSPSSVRWPVRAVSRPRRNPRSPQTARDCLNQSFLSFLSRSNKIKSLSLFPYTNNLRPSLGSSKLWNVVSNISRCVSVNDGKLWGLKTHDSHILLQQLIPIATIRVSDLNRLEADIVLILCKLERISPPTFFDVMIHLAVYLQAKTKIVGPIYSLRERGEASDDLYSVALGHINEVRTYSSYFVNGLRFHSIERDNRRTTQNSGITAYRETKADETNYYGVLQEVLDLEYPKCRRVCLFKCNWFDTNVKKNKFRCDLEFKIINTSRFWYTDDPYILTTQAVQVFYIDDLKLRSNWKIVQTVQNKQVWDIPESGEVEDDRFELLEACSSIGVDESIHDIPFCRGDVESTVVDHEETDNQDQSRIDDDFINDETEQLESSDSDNQARLALTEVEQTNTPSVDPSTPSGIGTAVRNTIPLGCENLKVVPMGVRELVIDRLEMQNTFREFRADLHKYYCEFDDPVEARANPPNRITLEDWNMMCDRWETDAWKKKREKNKRSRSAVMFNHVTEANSFLQVRYELKKKKGCDVDEIEVFHETHFREKEGWINDKAKDASLEMQRIITESTEAGVQTISSAKACEFVLRSRSMQTVNPRSGESLRSNVSSTCEKEKNEMAYQLMKS
ncbi:transposon protein, putative, CACTA, En/Spm sub-class [Cucumis melo var. makuwa]|uniref:Transposon protein, putative, CACTA, En/Spm sub-class n=1 Tax=Cucumis melo var. makuwa TaxID=1194695 RepID=A0A5A7VAV0_CUCMM|nr:transposon protein, putative, CACTA, En/Spm sub-class [Cucumis melo var. makuwa]